MYQLKTGQEGFEVVDGPDAGKTYRRGKSYPKVPSGYENRFEKISTGKKTQKSTEHTVKTTTSETATTDEESK